MKICNYTSNAFLIRNAVYASMITCNENTICYAYFTKNWKIISFDLDGKSWNNYNQINTIQLKLTLKQLYLQSLREEYPDLKLFNLVLMANRLLKNLTMKETARLLELPWESIY